MEQAKVSLTTDQLRFLANHEHYGFKDRSALIRAAVAEFQKRLEERELERSAEEYASIYAQDADLQLLTEVAVVDWPE